MFYSLFNKSLTRRATYNEKSGLKNNIKTYFGPCSVELFPFARTCLHALLVSINLPKGSTIIMTPITIGPMPEIIRTLGYNIIFVDIETCTFGPDIDDLRNKIAEHKPKVFLLTYLFGYVPKLDQIKAICDETNIFFIEDISHNIGSSHLGTPLGLWGDAAFYSASLLKYVDGYNGAFTLVKQEAIGQKVANEALKLTVPDAARIKKIIFKTLIWNLSLNSLIFSLFTFPCLRLLQKFSPKKFNALLGPGIKYQDACPLPSWYFEDITAIQVRTIKHNLEKLDMLLADRKLCASCADDVFANISSTDMKNNDRQAARNFHTYWQYVVNVKSSGNASKALFAAKVETNTTNLRDIASDEGIALKGARSVKQTLIFIPLHNQLKKTDYQHLHDILQKAGEIA